MHLTEFIAMNRLLAQRLCASLLIWIGTSLALAAPPSLELGPEIVRRSPPSGSGLARCEKAYYAVSDSTGLLYTLDSDFRVTATQRLRAKREHGAWLGRRIDPDFESIACVPSAGQDWLIVLGSGYRTGVNDSGHLLLPGDPSSHHQRRLEVLYAQLAENAGSAGQRLNIEGLAIAGKHAFLFPRAALFFRVSLDELIAYLRHESEQFTTITRYDTILPEIEGAQSAFSGAEYWPAANTLVFTASVETRDAKSPRRKRLNSVLGLIDLNLLTTEHPIDLRRHVAVLEFAGSTLHTKAESLLITSGNHVQAYGMLVSDNDDGKSVFRAFTLKRSASGESQP